MRTDTASDKKTFLRLADDSDVFLYVVVRRIGWRAGPGSLQVSGLDDLRAVR